MLEELLQEKGVPIKKDVNYLKMPVYAINNNVDGAHQFNILYKEAMEHKKWNAIVRTKSGGISIARTNFRPPMWDVRRTNACIEITVIWKKMLRIQFRHLTDVAEEGDKEKHKTDFNGLNAYTRFMEEAKKNGIDMRKYAVANGAEIKKEIEPYLIKLEKEIYKDKTFMGCHHIDFHNSFPAGLVNTHPEFRKTVEYFYEKRKQNPINKAVLNYTIGFFQSIHACNARYAMLSRDAINDNNRRLRELAERLKKAGCVILLWNTDGIWYKGPIYYGEGEGSALGEWENDHTNCQLRIKSKGAYEFIEDGVYYPVIRGYTKLDNVKSRKEWEWGDIYKLDATVIMFYWQKEKGITDEEGNLF